MGSCDKNKVTESVKILRPWTRDWAVQSRVQCLYIFNECGDESHNNSSSDKSPGTNKELRNIYNRSRITSKEDHTTYIRSKTLK